MDLMEILEQLNLLLGNLIQKYGPLGIAAAMFAESAGVPFASAIVVLTSGPLIFSGKVSFWSVLLASTAGITLGSIFSYSLGFLSSKAARAVKTTLTKTHDQTKPLPKQLRQSRFYVFWEKYGSFSVFMAQLWGVTRTFISFPAGVMHMNFFLFIIYTALGGALFSTGAIAFSFLITGAMGVILRLLQMLLGLSPWVWAAAALIIGLAVYLYRRKGWKLLPAFWINRAKNKTPRRK